MKYKVGDKFKYKHNNGKFISVYRLNLVSDTYDCNIYENGILMKTMEATQYLLDSLDEIEAFPWDKASVKTCYHRWKETVSPISGVKWKDCEVCGIRFEDYQERLNITTATRRYSYEDADC